MKILSALICFPSLALMSACGGGSVTTTSTGETFETLTIFSNDASAAALMMEPNFITSHRTSSQMSRQAIPLGHETPLTLRNSQ
jgi:hypothetical protein